MTTAGHFGAIYALEGKHPQIAEDAFIAPGAQIIGDVSIASGASVWFNCVLRGDANWISVGTRTNIQDGTVVHISSKDYPTKIGADILIGHMALIHACTLEDESFVAMGAIVMDGCVIETGGMLAAGALLTPGKRIPAGELWAGRPAKFVRKLGPADHAARRTGVAEYVRLAQRFRSGLAPLSP